MSSSSRVPAEGVRVHWEDLPTAIRAAVEEQLGSAVVEAVTQPAGFSPGLAARLLLRDGSRAFVKAVSESANPDSPAIHRREARIVAALPPTAPVPRFLWSLDEGGWVVLAFEDVEARHPDEPWTETDLDLVVSALRDMSRALTPSPIEVDQTAGDAFRRISGWQRALAGGEHRLDVWTTKNLKRLADLESQAPVLVGGNTLLHFDIRADNLLITADQRVYVVDWPWARIGAPFVDWLTMAPSVAMQGGPQPEDFLARFDVADVPPHSIDAALCSLAGFFVVHSLQPPPPGLPTLRAFQAAQGAVALAWLRERLGDQFY